MLNAPVSKAPKIAAAIEQLRETIATVDDPRLRECVAELSMAKSAPDDRQALAHVQRAQELLASIMRADAIIPAGGCLYQGKRLQHFVKAIERPGLTKN